MKEVTTADTAAFWRLQEGFLCLSPGSEASTERALGFLPRLPAVPKILDAGCGRGRQTFALARMTSGQITAVDVLPPFVDALRERAAQEGFADRIDAVVASMVDLTPPADGFDLIWSEGAVYNVGFEHALRTWRPWLAAGGCIGVSEVAWLVPAPPRAAREFWQAGYPSMQHHTDNLQSMEACGYELLGSFPLSASDWDAYYGPRDERIAEMRKGEHDPEMLAALDRLAAEARLYRESHEAYGYVFYVMRPVAGS